MKHDSRTRALFIGLDAMDKDLIQQWIKEGQLSHLGKLMQSSAWGRSLNPPGLYVGAVWPSFFTGLTPARHGRYCYTQFQPGTYDSKTFRPEDLKAEPFWNTLGREGHRVCVIDVPLTSASKGLNGIHVVDWATHDSDYEVGFSWPPEVYEELENKFGRGDTIGKCDYVKHTREGLTEFVRALKDRIRKKGNACRYLLDKGGWDFFLNVFSESHCIGHQCWHLHDPDHPRHNKDLVRQIGDPMLSVYKALDEEVGGLLDYVGSQTPVLVLASHGMGPHYNSNHMLEDILRRIEDTEKPQDLEKLGAGKPMSWKTHTRRIWRKLPAKVRQNLFVGVRKELARDFQDRLFFQVPNNSALGAIRVNLAGREPQGRVQPGAEYEKICKTLIQDLFEVTYMETGHSIIENAFHVRDVYPGQDTNHLPDIFLEWRREASARWVKSPKIGEIDGFYGGYRSGDHKPEGLFFIRHPQIPAGAVSNPVQITDFAPTLASWLGTKLENVDGKSLTSLLGARA